MEVTSQFSENENLEPESLVLAELNRVLFQELDEVGSEHRLDLAYEVMETVRYEQAHISWLDRLRNSTGDLEIQISNTKIPSVTGNLMHLSDPFLILRNSQAQFLINSNYVTGVRGLNQLAGAAQSLDKFNWLDNVWFHDLSDRRVRGTWYLMDDQVIEGYCLRTGYDAIDISTASKVQTIPKRAIVVSRIVTVNELAVTAGFGRQIQLWSRTRLQCNFQVSYLRLAIVRERQS